MAVTSPPKDLIFESRLMSRPMAFARFVRQGHPVPSSTKMILYGLEAAQDLMVTIRDLRRTVKLVQSGLITLFPDEAFGLQLMYSTLDRDLLQVERVGQLITTQLLTALTETHEDVVQLAAFSCLASRGLWINRLYLLPSSRGLITDKSGALPVPLDARPFRVVVHTVQVTANLGGFLDLTALPLPISTLADTVFRLIGMARPPGLSIWTEVAAGIDTAVQPVRLDTLLTEIVRAIQPLIRIQILIQDPPNAARRDSTRELLSPDVFLL